MGVQGCIASLGFWTLGMTGQCFPPEAGFRIGKNGPKVASMQVLQRTLHTVYVCCPSIWNSVLFVGVVHTDPNTCKTTTTTTTTKKVIDYDKTKHNNFRFSFLPACITINAAQYPKMTVTVSFVADGH